MVLGDFVILMETLNVLKLSIPALDSKECKAIMGGDGYYDGGNTTDLPDLDVDGNRNNYPDDFGYGYDADDDLRDNDDDDNEGKDHDENQDGVEFPYTFDRILPELTVTAQLFYNYLNNLGLVKISFSSALQDSSGRTNIDTGEIVLAFSPDHIGTPWDYKMKATHEIGHMYQKELGLSYKFTRDAPLEYQSNALDFISGNEPNSNFLGESQGEFEKWLGEITDENGIDLNKFEEGIGEWYDDFVDHWAGKKESYSDDPDYKYKDDIDDMNWEDMFDFYGIRYHR